MREFFTYYGFFPVGCFGCDFISLSGVFDKRMNYTVLPDSTFTYPSNYKTYSISYSDSGYMIFSEEEENFPKSNTQAKNKSYDWWKENERRAYKQK